MSMIDDYNNLKKPYQDVVDKITVEKEQIEKRLNSTIENFKGQGNEIKSKLLNENKINSEHK